MTKIYYVVYPDSCENPNRLEIVNAHLWQCAVAYGSSEARSDEGFQSFLEEVPLTPGTYKAAFVAYLESEYSDVSISDGYIYVGQAGDAGVLLIWDGSAWSAGVVKAWNGTSWVNGTLKQWNGTSWVS